MSVMSVKLGGIKFKLPFVDLIEMDTHDEEVLAESIKRLGKVRNPIVCWKEKSKRGEEETVVDGAHRVIHAVAAGLDKVPIQYRSYASDEEAEADCEEENFARRQASDKMKKERHAKRIKKAAELRTEGHSTRDIAEQLEVSQSQVMRDLQAATEPGGSVEPPDGKVNSKDGKKRPAKKALTLCERCERLKPGVGLPDCPNCAALRAKKKPKAARKKPQPPAVVKDKTGEKVPDRLRDAFADPSLSDLVGELESVEAMFAPKSVVERAGKLTAHYPFILIAKVDECLHESLHQLQVALQSLKAGLPHAVCPKCKAEENCKPCKTCRGCGHVPEHRYKELSAEKA